MKFIHNIFLYGIIGLVNFCIILASKGYCIKDVIVIKSRMKNVQKNVYITQSNGFYGRVRKYVPASFSIEEYYNTTEKQNVCCEGYVPTPQACKPFCTEACAINQECVEPDVCQCWQGYVEINGVCEPHCNQICDQNKYCAAPDLCRCKQGYKVYEFSNDQNCVPECKESIPIHSECIAPNVWRCQKGYVENDLSQCAPVCSPNCSENSVCVGPNKCQCQPGYEEDELNAKCIPKCTTDCIKPLECTAPNVCGCPAGYEFQNESAELPHCAPICAQNCSDFGKCVAPNVCQCLDGYEQQYENKNMPLCRPKCCQKCLNGFCALPDVCVCNPGYRMGPNNKCVAICSQGCQFGDCTEPEICTCWPGYQLKTNSINICEPICSQSCINADCVAPGLCSCWPNYAAQRDAQHDEPLVCEAQQLDNFQESTTELFIEVDTTTAAYNCPSSCACWEQLSTENITSSCLSSCSHQPNINETCLDISTCSCEKQDSYAICVVTLTNATDENIRYQCREKEEVASALPNTAAFWNVWSVLLFTLAGFLVLLTILVFLLKRFIKPTTYASYNTKLECVDLRTE